MWKVLTRLLTYLFLFLVVTTASAVADATTDSIVQGTLGADINPYTEVATDYSVSMLRSIFGTVPGAISGGNSIIVGEMFNVFNAGMLGLIFTILIYTVISSVIFAAQDGTPIANRFTPAVMLRVAFGVALVVPVSGGYCMAQSVAMWITVKGVYLADAVWSQTVDYLQQARVDLISSESVTTSTADGADSQTTYNYTSDYSKLLLGVDTYLSSKTKIAFPNTAASNGKKIGMLDLFQSMVCAKTLYYADDYYYRKNPSSADRAPVISDYGFHYNWDEQTDQCSADTGFNTSPEAIYFCSGGPNSNKTCNHLNSQASNSSTPGIQGQGCVTQCGFFQIDSSIFGSDSSAQSNAKDYLKASIMQAAQSLTVDAESFVEKALNTTKDCTSDGDCSSSTYTLACSPDSYAACEMATSALTAAANYYQLTYALRTSGSKGAASASKWDWVSQVKSQGWALAGAYYRKLIASSNSGPSQASVQMIDITTIVPQTAVGHTSGDTFPLIKTVPCAPFAAYPDSTDYNSNELLAYARMSCGDNATAKDCKSTGSSMCNSTGHTPQIYDTIYQAGNLQVQALANTTAQQSVFDASAAPTGHEQASALDNVIGVLVTTLATQSTKTEWENNLITDSGFKFWGASTASQVLLDNDDLHKPQYNVKYLLDAGISAMTGLNLYTSNATVLKLGTDAGLTESRSNDTICRTIPQCKISSISSYNAGKSFKGCANAVFSQGGGNTCVVPGVGFLGSLMGTQQGMFVDPLYVLTYTGQVMLNQATNYTTVQVRTINEIVVTMVQRMVDTLVTTTVVLGSVTVAMGFLSEALGLAFSGISQMIVGAIGTVYNAYFQVDMMALQAYLPLGTAISGLYYIMGFTLGIYIPFIPFLLFMAGVIGWLIAVAELMIAAPVVAVGVTYPEGHEIWGLANQAMVIIIGVFLRPVMITFGFILGIFLIYTSLNLLQLGVIQSMADILVSYMQSDANNSRELVVVAVMILYTMVAIEVVNSSLSLIYVLPDKITRWLGGQPDQTGGIIAQGMAHGVRDKGEQNVGGAAGRATGEMARPPQASPPQMSMPQLKPSRKGEMNKGQNTQVGGGQPSTGGGGAGGGAGGDGSS